MKDLTPNQMKALCMLAANYDRHEVAQACDITTRTLDKWRRLENFQELLRKAVVATYDAAISELVLGCQESAKELRKIILDPDTPSRTKVSAISVLLTNAAKAKEHLLEDRLERIEASLNGDITEQDTEA
ncbi:hypothetical protein [Scytonema sp. PCC 10023]|uniref:hypothetical protein n=1 Tax=Scytonema sp. PCC 10023 TaxID=1680591 RepID=UPI0039C752E6